MEEGRWGHQGVGELWGASGCGGAILPPLPHILGYTTPPTSGGLPPVKIVNIFNQPVKNFIKKVNTNY